MQTNQTTKRNLLLLPIALISSAFLVPAFADDDDDDDDDAPRAAANIPAAVQETIRQHQGRGVLEYVRATTLQGKSCYVAEIELKDDRDLKLHITPDGAVLQSRKDIPLRAAPQAVREAAKGLVPQGGHIDDVDEIVSGGKKTYRVEIDGRDDDANDDGLDLVIGEDGVILSKTADLD